MSEVPSPPSGCSFLIEIASDEEIFSPERFTEEQRMFAQSAEDFVKREIRPDIARLERQEDNLMLEKLRKAADLGLLMIDIPEAYGGLELDMATSMLCSEKMGSYASWLITLGAHTGIGTLPLLFFGTDDQKRRYLPKLGTGELIAAYALSEPSSGSDAMNARTRAELVETDDGKKYWKLTGTKMWITNGAWATLLTVFAKVNGQAFSAFLVEAPAEGLSIGAEEQKMGIKGSSTTQITFDGVLIPEANLLGQIGKGHKIAFNVLNVGRFKLGVGAIGACKHFTAVAVRYAKDRIAFGQPISDFGAIRKKVAEMAVGTFALESMCYRVGGYMTETIKVLDSTSDGYSNQVMKAIEEYAVEDSIMKVYGSEILEMVVDEGVQIHGGYGFHRDFEVERGYRDNRINRIFEGTNEINRMLMVGTVLKRTMKGQIPLFAAVQAMTDELKSPAPSPPALRGDDGTPNLDWETFFAKEARKVLLYTLNAAVQRFMTQLKDEQEVLVELADQMMLLYAIDSTLSRVRSFPSENKMNMLRILTAESYQTIVAVAKRLAPALVNGVVLADHLATLEQLSHPVAANTIALKRAVAAVVITREGY